MVYLFLAIGALVFVICFKLLDVGPHVRAIVPAARQAHGIIRSVSLTDEAKQTAIQKAATIMAGSAVVILGRMALCLMMPMAAVWLGAQSGAYTMADALAAAPNWTFIIASSLVMLPALIVAR
jgi:hypothetical protein